MAQHPASESGEGAGTPVTTTHVTVRGKKYLRYLVRYDDEAAGTRKRRTFGTLAEARRFAEQCGRDAAIAAERQAILQRRVGEEDAAKLSAAHLRDAVAALAVLAGRGSLTAAAELFVRDYEARKRDVPTVARMVETYLDESVAQGLRPRSLGDLRHRLSRLAEAFGSRRINDVSHAEAQQWLAGLCTRERRPLSALSRQHFRFAAGALFNRAVELGYIDANPIAAKTRSRRAKGSNRMESTAEILTPAEAKALLFAAAEHVPSVMPALALALFAGVRSAELSRMTWERHVSLEKGMVLISGDIAKKRSVRNIAMMPNLVRWLALAPSREGFVMPQGKAGRTAIELARSKAKLTRWPHNGMRHSFASYHLEFFQDPQRTSLMLGHRGGSDLLFEHYRQLTSAASAAEYWKIEPAATGADSLTAPGGATGPAQDP